jgi:hypothetical protein
VEVLLRRLGAGIALAASLCASNLGLAGCGGHTPTASSTAHGSATSAARLDPSMCQDPGFEHSHRDYCDGTGSPAPPWPAKGSAANSASGQAAVALACSEIIPAITNTVTQLQHDGSVNVAVEQVNSLMNEINTVAARARNNGFRSDVEAIGTAMSDGVDRAASSGGQIPDFSGVQQAIEKVGADCIASGWRG